ncbi:Het-C-domain-containing protein [Saccharata proteae CBS 121410]|uniref:Het-C-domain-containing protein n=1 Tax=Saccharata proteae CBS 121410 TaxID=1314787 RepID=A0A9P4I0L4_9PEZI|nr:Het-C-domain-containing protein [Saccharata proteae CBS 121410]
MPGLRLPPASWLLPCLVLLLVFAKPSHAFGAGNIASTAKIEGTNWRHGDIEDTLLSILMGAMGHNKKFTKKDVRRVYFGNWLRDYSQAVDVGTLKMVSGEAIRLLLWILGFMSFGYGTGEYEVTAERLGCYRPEEHIDNPKNYADNIDARQYDRRLRGPVDEEVELAINERTGLKNYIASEDLGIETSAGLVRRLFSRSIELARRFNQTGDKKYKYEALRLLGTGCHCLEDYSAHSNYTELALIEMGERDIFPHVGRDTKIQLHGARHAVYPIVTGTFGGVDFLHSVIGEFTDKTTQSEVQELEGTIEASQNRQSNSILKDLLGKLPGGLFGGDDQANKVDELQASSDAAQMNNLEITPKEPEAFAQQLGDIQKQIYPILEFHDQFMHNVDGGIQKIPILPDLIEQIQDELNMFVFSLLAPFILPVIRQIKEELSTGSSEVIQSSQDQQLIVFNDDSSSDPTHSMLSKDHFSNRLNEPAGKVASQVLKWAVPQLVQCWDDESADADRVIERIINGVFHHPALRHYGDDGASDGRQLMFQVVEQWWQENQSDEMRDALSRDGVENGRNHKEGVHDSGHGCGKPLGQTKVGAAGGRPNASSSGSGNQPFENVGKMAGEAVGGGALGGILGGIVGGIGSSLLGGGKDKEEKESYASEGYGSGGEHHASYAETGQSRNEERYGQAEYRRTEYPQGGRTEEFSRYEQEGREPRTGYGFNTRVEEGSYGQGGYERREETRFEDAGGRQERRERREGVDEQGEFYDRETRYACQCSIC